MAVQVLVFLLVCFLLSLALLWSLGWFLFQPSHARTGARSTSTHRLLKPRTPLDCPVCRRTDEHSSVLEPQPTPVRPWCELKSRRGAPKRVNTEGFACPNQQCAYFGITETGQKAPRAFKPGDEWPYLIVLTIGYHNAIL